MFGTQTLAALNDPNLRVYVVWTPMLTPDFQFTVRRATTFVPDWRASHFWDRDGQLSKDYARVLNVDTGTRAWDVYLVYGREVVWTEAPPAPGDLMDQLGLKQGHPLNGDQLAAELRKLLQAN